MTSVHQHVEPDHVHPVEGKYLYRVDLVLTDAKTAARISGAKVTVNILGLGHVPGASVITMLPADVGGGPGYSHEIPFQYASTYRLTFRAKLAGWPAPVKAAFAFRRPS